MMTAGSGGYLGDPTDPEPIVPRRDAAFGRYGGTAAVEEPRAWVQTAPTWALDERQVRMACLRLVVEFDIFTDGSITQVAAELAKFVLTGETDAG